MSLPVSNLNPSLIVLFAAPFLSGQTADEIMSRVAENQNRAQESRSAFVYNQNLLVRMKRANGKLAREEVRDYIVTPHEDHSTKELTRLAGRYELKGRVLSYSERGFRRKSVDLDGEIIEELADKFAGDEKSRDGIHRDMFPLTAIEQRRYTFHLDGTEKYRDRDVFRITFLPKKGEKKGEDDLDWAGEALVDTHEFQPVLITTHLPKGLPLLVKTLLGTDLKQVGFKVTYQKIDEGLWFPATYGGELKVRALFLYARSMSIGVINSEFKRADVRTTVTFGEESKIP